MAIDRGSSAIPAPQVRTPEEVVVFLGDQLERQGRHPTAGLPVDLHPLLDAAPPGEERAEVVELIDSCQHSWGWIDHSGGKGYNYVLTPLGLDGYTQIQEARRKAKLAQKPLIGLGMAAERWYGQQRNLFPLLSPLIEKAIVGVVAFVIGLVVGLLF